MSHSASVVRKWQSLKNTEGKQLRSLQLRLSNHDGVMVVDDIVFYNLERAEYERFGD